MDVAALAVAATAYGAGQFFSPRMPDGRWITPIGAMGPALVALGPDGFDVAPYWVLIASASAVDAAVTLIRRRGLRLPERIRHAILLTACAALFAFLARTSAQHDFEHASATLQLAVVALCTFVFAFGEAILRGVASGLRRDANVLSSVGQEFRLSAAVHLAYASTAGLVVLSYQALGPVAFLILLGPLYATSRGFSRFTDARNTYAQTVRALGRLTERGGYAPAGHHERVASLCTDVAHELGIWGEPVRMLQLVALFHEVGAVSVPDPEDLPDVPKDAIADAGARVLEETGYLARQAPLLAEAARAPSEECALEARILRVTSRYDDLRLAHGDAAITRLELDAVDGDRPVFEALVRVLDKRRSS